jgi:hypothetical protein
MLINKIKMRKRRNVKQKRRVFLWRSTNELKNFSIGDNFGKYQRKKPKKYVLLYLQ